MKRTRTTAGTAAALVAVAATLGFVGTTASVAHADSGSLPGGLVIVHAPGTKAPIIGSPAHLPDLGTSSTYQPGPGMAPAITGFYNSGAYSQQQNAVGRAALRELNRWHRQGCGKSCKPAIVFDLDDTTWSWYPYFSATNFAPPGPASDVAKADCVPPLIPATKAVIDRAVKLGVTVFFISGRASSDEAITKNCLVKYGLPSDHLILQTPDQQQFSRAVFKNNARASIEKAGYTIGLNVGDQVSDVTGSHFRSGFLLPNPMYFTP